MACCVKDCNSRKDKKGSEKRSLFTPRTVFMLVLFSEIIVGFMLRNNIFVQVFFKVIMSIYIIQVYTLFNFFIE